MLTPEATMNVAGGIAGHAGHHRALPGGLELPVGERRTLIRSHTALVALSK